MILLEIKQIKLKSGSTAHAVAEFNDGYSHIVCDDNCWVVVNGGGFSAWIFKEAMEHLRQLPANPHDYEPLRRVLGMSTS